MRVAVIGSGYVGLVTGTGFAQIGHQVTCVDTAADRVALVNHGRAPFHEPGLAEMLSSCVKADRLRASTDALSAVATSDVAFLAVGTPFRDGKMDVSYLSAAAEAVGRGLRSDDNYRVVVVKSTVTPGTTDTLVRGLLERSSGLQAGSFGLCMNPEFLREGSAVEDFMKPDRIVIGQWDQRSGARLAELYNSFDCPKLFTSIGNAEMTKMASNALLATLISFSNELAAICEAAPGADVDEVLSALHLDRRFSNSSGSGRSVPGILAYLRAGCGFGGSCLPKDLSALRHYARRRAVVPHILDGVAAVNEARPRQLLALAERAVGTLRGTAVAVLGLAFKPGTDDLRDSPALAIASLLQQRGATVRAYDPMFSTQPCVSGLNVSVSAKEALTDADAAILVTAWPEFAAWNWEELCALMRRPILVDGRNALTRVRIPERAIYVCIGTYFQPEEARVAG